MSTSPGSGRGGMSSQRAAKAGRAPASGWRMRLVLRSPHVRFGGAPPRLRLRDARRPRPRSSSSQVLYLGSSRWTGRSVTSFQSGPSSWRSVARVEALVRRGTTRQDGARRPGCGLPGGIPGPAGSPRNRPRPAPSSSAPPSRASRRAWRRRPARGGAQGLDPAAARASAPGSRARSSSWIASRSFGVALSRAQQTVADLPGAGAELVAAVAEPRQRGRRPPPGRWRSRSGPRADRPPAASPRGASQPSQRRVPSAQEVGTRRRSRPGAGSAR